MKGMKDLVDKYAKDFPAHKPAGGVPLQEDTILVTGTTGAIGSVTLAELYKSPNVARSLGSLLRLFPSGRGGRWWIAVLIQAS